MKQFQKQFGCKAVAVAGAEISADMLAKINSFALEPLTADRVYVRKFLLCHSAIDRDNERFPKIMIDDFARSLPGKSFLFVHDRRSLPFGLFFDASVEEMSPEQFKALTTVEAKLPEGEATVGVVWAWSYMLNEDFNAPVMKNIDGGVYRHVSIGFGATDLKAIKKEINGPVQYWEYVPPGEALEGSLVWLGAQPGATAQKSLGDPDTTKGVITMKEFIANLGKSLGLTLDENSATEQILGAFKSLQKKVDELEPLAEMGKRFRDDLVERYVKAKSKLGEVATTEEAQKGMKGVVCTFPITFIDSEVKALEKRVMEKFPAESQLEGADGEKHREKGADQTDAATKKAHALVA
jgi:hypothetical protein